MVLGGIILVLIHAEDHRQILPLGGRGDDDLACAAGDVLGRVRGVGEPPRAFDDDIDSEVLPRERAGILLLEDPDPVSVDGDRIGIVRDGALVRPMDGIVLEEVGQGRRVREIVDGDELDGGAVFLGRANDLTADAAESVDANFEGHEA